MEVTKKVLRPATEETVVIGLKCDMCGNLYREENGWDTCETRVSLELRLGDGYGHTVKYEEYKTDLCSTCFSNKLIPWLQAEGCTIQVSEEDW